ncbi:hypothetical protein [Lacticaseibacillus absianus]|uniref:hypothetical protein n=1 Tax=Lacticaseibacillus absianus TaxID=2729623 RepID=UPI0015C98A58|nr:hypothetical protein [Lacticaseibacillus absianus]
MQNLQTKISAELIAKIDKNAKYQAEFDQPDQKQFERDLDKMLQDEQIKQAMLLLADA